MVRPKLAPLMALVTMLTLLAGCSTPSESDDQGDAGGPTAVQDAQGRYVVRLTSDNQFHPAELSVPVGATVVWMNDGGTHTVTSDDDDFSSGTPRSDTGEVLSHMFSSAGIFTYFCQPHQSIGMTGSIQVA